MEEWKERLIEEQKELKEKFVKLVDFMQTEKFFSLSPNYRKVLNNQKIAMEMYLNALNTRIFEDVDNKLNIPDFGMLGMFGSIFNNSLNFPPQPNESEPQKFLNPQV